MAFSDLVESVDSAVRSTLGGESTIVYTPTVGDAETVEGVFDLIAVESEFGVAREQDRIPAVFVRLADLPSDPESDNATITVDGTDYAIRECEPDSISGSVRILLREA